MIFIFSVPIKNVESVLGGIAELPCDVTPEDVHDDVYLILWFKDEASKPMYRYYIVFLMNYCSCNLVFYSRTKFQKKVS